MHNIAKGLKIVLESAHEAVSVSPTVWDFSMDEARKDEFVTAVTRENVSTSITRSERPVSKETQAKLCNLVRPYVPAQPQEGLLPLKVYRISPQEREWLQDRAGDFVNYKESPTATQRPLVAVNTISDDKRTRSLTAVVLSVESFPLRLDFTIEGMLSQCGWTNRRPLFRDVSLDKHSRACELLDAVYGNFRPTLGPVCPPQDLSVVVFTAKVLR
ncbi:hypothetical protein Q1695_000957 [Nippostrongylus brasiliensis]|nr:hypothetical protein Q1695_000957 [Nippostrongylus brasiliensis]